MKDSTVLSATIILAALLLFGFAFCRYDVTAAGPAVALAYRTDRMTGEVCVLRPNSVTCLGGAALVQNATGINKIDPKAHCTPRNPDGTRTLLQMYEVVCD